MKNNVFNLCSFPSRSRLSTMWNEYHLLTKLEVVALSYDPSFSPYVAQVLNARAINQRGKKRRIRNLAYEPRKRSWWHICHIFEVNQARGKESRLADWPSGLCGRLRPAKLTNHSPRTKRYNHFFHFSVEDESTGRKKINFSFLPSNHWNYFNLPSQSLVPNDDPNSEQSRNIVLFKALHYCCTDARRGGGGTI